MDSTRLEDNVFEVQRMGVNVTGARPGESLIGIQLCAKDALITIHSGFVPPLKDDLNKIREEPPLWNTFLMKLGSIPFYQPMSLEDRAAYLQSVEIPGDYDMAEIENVTIEVNELGKSNFLTLGEETIDHILQTKLWNTMELRNLFPRKPGSKARRQTLILFHCYWKIHCSYTFEDSFQGLVYSFIHHQWFPQGYSMDADKKDKEHLLRLENYPASYEAGKQKGIWTIKDKQPIGIHMSKHIEVPTSWKSVCYQRFGAQDVPILDDLWKLYGTLSPSFHKSLMQKLIRYAPSYVLLHDTKIPTHIVLISVFAYLMDHPGVFVPDIQRFVSGQESAIKRLLICIFEDAYAPPSSYPQLLEMAVMCTVTQRVNTWKPSVEQFLWMVDLLMEAWSTIEQRFQYECPKDTEPYSLSAAHIDKPLRMISAILDDVKSFAGDLAMVRYIATHELHAKRVAPIVRPHEMRYEHCLDQHCIPNIVYFMPYHSIYSYYERSSKPLAALYRNIFVQVTGKNPRTHLGTSLEADLATDPFVSLIRQAQTMCFAAKLHRSSTTPLLVCDRQHTKKGFPISYSLPFSWVAGMAGVIEIGTTLVSMKPDDPYQLIVIRRPSRGLKDGHVEDQIVESSIASAKKILRTQGVALNKAFAPLKSLEHVYVQLVSTTSENTGEQDTEEYRFFIRDKPKKLYTWAEIATLQEDIPFFSSTVYDAMDWSYFHLDMLSLSLNETTHSSGIYEHAFTIVEQWIEKHMPYYDVWQRFLSYIASVKPSIELYPCSKDGGGTQQMIVFEDVACGQILYLFTVLFPCMLSLDPHHLGRFHIRHVPLLTRVREFIRVTMNKIPMAQQTTPTVASKKGKGTLTGFFTPVDTKKTKEIASTSSTWPITDIHDTTGRVLRNYQVETVEEMIQKSKEGRKGHFLWITAGLGKTMIVCTFLQRILVNETLKPKYVLYTLPKSAMESVLQELQYFHYPINVLIPLKSYKKGSNKYVVDPLHMLPYHINVVEHDHLRLLEEECLQKANETYFIVDEVHKALNDTKRTSIALDISRVAKDFVAMTGTPIVDSNTYKLIWWLEQIVDFEVNETNMWVAANGMIAKKVNTGILVDDADVVATMTHEEEQVYLSMIPPGMGGTNQKPSAQDIRQAFTHCYEVADREIIKQTMDFLQEGKRVMIVAQHMRHQERLKELCVASKMVNDRDVYVLQAADSIFMTDELVEAKKIPDYRIVIVPMRKSEGYTLTRMNVMITGVYPSNNATREQLRGRINRLSQHAPMVHYRTVHCGILSYVMQKHQNAASLQAVLSALAKDVLM